MKRLFLLLSAFALLVLSAASDGSPVTPEKPHPLNVPGLESRYFSVECKGGERSCAIAIGNGRSYMGVYVYDIHGNCVAWDDEGAPRITGDPGTSDDLAVEWYPPQKGTYLVEVHNSSFRSDDCKFWLR